MFELKGLKLLASFAGVFLLCGSVWAGDGVISRVPDPSGSFCHLRFPAIRDDTLFLDQPVLKDASEGDVIDAYGPCNFDPSREGCNPPATARPSAPNTVRARLTGATLLTMSSRSAPADLRRKQPRNLN